MKKTKSFLITITLVVLTLLVACSDNPAPSSSITLPTKSTGQIYLYGEWHGEKIIIDEKFKLWQEFYHEDGMRHLFLESSYYAAEFLNLWMLAEDDKLLDKCFSELGGTLEDNPYSKEFYKNIKTNCPETVFHGTDVGHQHETTGLRFLKYLETNNLKGSAEYLLAEEAIEQGKSYYNSLDEAYRENIMVANFIREFDKLIDEDIMGIYGGAHTGLNDMNYTGVVSSMAKQLKEYYGEAVHSVDLSPLAEASQSLRIDWGSPRKIIPPDLCMLKRL